MVCTVKMISMLLTHHSKTEIWTVEGLLRFHLWYQFSQKTGNFVKIHTELRCAWLILENEITFKLNKIWFLFVQYRYAKEFLETRLFFGTDQWTKNQTLVIFSEQAFVPWIMGEGDFIVGNRRVRIYILIHTQPYIYKYSYTWFTNTYIISIYFL